MTEEVILNKGYKSFVLIECACGCGELINSIDNRGRPRKFKNNHHNRRENHYKWKGGIIIDNKGYERELRPDHPFCDSQGYVKKHRLVYEQHYNCILLSYVDIDHKNKIRNDNRIENLRPLYRSNHISMHMIGNTHGKGNRGKKKSFVYHPKMNMDGRICFDCLFSSTNINKDGNTEWRLYLHVFLCKNCYSRRQYRISKYK